MEVSVKIVFIEKLMLTRKRNTFSLPYATDMASTFSMYHPDCTTHTTKPVAHVAPKIVFQNVLYMKNLAYSPWSSRHWLKPKLLAIPIVYDYYDAKF